MAPTPREGSTSPPKNALDADGWIDPPTEDEVEGLLDLYLGVGLWHVDRSASRPRYVLHTPMGKVRCRTVHEAWHFLLGYETAMLGGRA